METFPKTVGSHKKTVARTKRTRGGHRAPRVGKPDCVHCGNRLYNVKRQRQRSFFYREVNLPFAMRSKTLRGYGGGSAQLPGNSRRWSSKNFPCAEIATPFRPTANARHGRGLCKRQRRVHRDIRAREMILATSDIITWSDYKRDEKDPTFGLLSQVSPDGRFVVSTVKDRSVFVAKPDLAFSQLFFPPRHPRRLFKGNRIFRPSGGRRPRARAVQSVLESGREVHRICPERVT